MRVEGRAARKADSPLGGEGGFTGDVRISLLLGKSWQRQQRVQRHQAGNKGCSIIAGGQSGRWGVVAEIGASEGGGVWIKKSLEGLLAVELYLVGNRESLKM